MWEKRTENAVYKTAEISATDERKLALRAGGTAPLDVVGRITLLRAPPQVGPAARRRRGSEMRE
eukprot:gene11064-7695_t